MAALSSWWMVGWVVGAVVVALVAILLLAITALARKTDRVAKDLIERSRTRSRTKTGPLQDVAATNYAVADDHALPARRARRSARRRTGTAPRRGGENELDTDGSGRIGLVLGLVVLLVVIWLLNDILSRCARSPPTSRWPTRRRCSRRASPATEQLGTTRRLAESVPPLALALPATSSAGRPAAPPPAPVAEGRRRHRPRQRGPVPAAPGCAVDAARMEDCSANERHRNDRAGIVGKSVGVGGTRSSSASSSCSS